MRATLRFVKCRHLVAFAFAIVVYCPDVTEAEGSGQPAYLQHGTDPVQRIYSKALIGFALNQKCRLLTDAAAADYERVLNRAGAVFQGYVAAQKFVSSPDLATSYTEAMNQGARSVSLHSAFCDAEAKEAVESGKRTAENFIPLLRDLFEEPTRN